MIVTAEPSEGRAEARRDAGRGGGSRQRALLREVRGSAQTFLAQAAETGHTGDVVPAWVEHNFQAYLR